LLVLRGGGKGAKAGGSGGAGGGSRNKAGGPRKKKRPGRSGKEARKRRVRRIREHSRQGGEQVEDRGGEGVLDPAVRATGAAAGEGRRTIAENRMIKEMRAKSRHEAPPLMSKSTFSGLFDLSPPVDLPGHTGLTLEHFRGERRNVDDDGNELPKRTYT